MKKFILILLFTFNAHSSVIDDEIRTAMGPSLCTFIVSSGLRTVEDNNRVYGAPKSYHLIDRARDLVFTSEECKQEALQRFYLYGLTVIKYRVHLHIDNRTEQKCLVHYKFRKYRACTEKEMM